MLVLAVVVEEGALISVPMLRLVLASCCLGSARNFLWGLLLVLIEQGADEELLDSGSRVMQLL